MSAKQRRQASWRTQHKKWIKTRLLVLQPKPKSEKFEIGWEKMSHLTTKDLLEIADWLNGVNRSGDKEAAGAIELFRHICQVANGAMDRLTRRWRPTALELQLLRLCRIEYTFLVAKCEEMILIQVE